MACELPSIYVLTCPELGDREARCRAHMAERGLDPVYWRAFHGASWGFETSLEYDVDKRLPPGHVALNASSWALWQFADNCSFCENKDPADPVIFFEDDAVIPEEFPRQISDLRDELKDHMPEWDLVFLGLAETNGPGVWNKVSARIGPPNSRLCQISNPFGTHALMIRRRAIPVLLEHMRYAHKNLDQQLWERVLEPGLLKWCCVLPSIVRQRTFDYEGTGRPEWKASTLRPGDEKIVHKDPEPAPHEQLPGRPTQEVFDASIKYIDRYSCFFRGEALDDIGVDGGGRSSVIMECARLGVSCHNYEDRLVSSSNGSVKSCQSCILREEMKYTKVARPRLDLPDGHFNCSLIDFENRFILATRDSWGHSKIALWDLTNSSSDWSGAWRCTPIGSFGSVHPQAPRLEDPRLFLAPHPATKKAALHAALSLPDGYPPKVVNMGWVRFSEGLRGIEHTEILESPFGNAYEKNWSNGINPESGQWYWVYGMKPHHVVLESGHIWSTPNPFRWTGGVMRGGATPFLVVNSSTGPAGQMYSFFHGVLKRSRGNVYTVGVYTYEPVPPYRILRLTPTPIMWPDSPAHDETVVKRMVLWPGGVISRNGRYHIALGVDDTNCRIASISHEEVEDALRLTQVETDNFVGVRDTSVALGVKKRHDH